MKGDNDYYYVNYTDYNYDGYDESAALIMHYENGSWNFELPGFSGAAIG